MFRNRNDVRKGSTKILSRLISFGMNSTYESVKFTVRSVVREVRVRTNASLGDAGALKLISYSPIYILLGSFNSSKFSDHEVLDIGA